MQRARLQQPRGEQALTAAEVDQTFCIGDQTVFEQAKEYRISIQLAPGEVPGEVPGRAVGACGTVEEGVAKMFGHGMAARKVTEWRLVCARLSSRRGSTSRMTGLPSAVR